MLKENKVNIFHFHKWKKKKKCNCRFLTNKSVEVEIWGLCHKTSWTALFGLPAVILDMNIFILM